MTPQTISNGEFEIVRITADLYDAVEALYMENFPNHENVCQATKLRESPQAKEELRQLLRVVLLDGVSLAARHLASGEVVAICCNKILNPRKRITLDSIFETFSSPSMIKIGSYLERMETTYDIFKEWQVECAFAIEFLAVSTKWGQRGLGYSLFEHSMKFARAMSKGTLEPEVLDQLPEQIREERPEAVMGVMTSLFTQKISKKLGLQTLTSIPMIEFSYDGQTFADRIQPIHKCSEFTALKL